MLPHGSALPPQVANSERAGKDSDEPCPVPLRRWQSRHWRWFWNTGACFVA